VFTCDGVTDVICDVDGNGTFTPPSLFENQSD
jgi:hypothetical protein